MTTSPRHLKTGHRQNAGAILVTPPWPNTGSANIYAAQAAAHKRVGHETLLVLGPLYQSPNNQEEISNIETEMLYDGISIVVHGLTSDTMRSYVSKSFLDWVLAGCDDSLSIRARYAARSRWRARILNFIDGHRVDVIHVNHAFEMLLGVRIRDLVFRRTGRTPSLICDTHDIQSKVYTIRGEENPFNGRKDAFASLLNSELSFYRKADMLIHCSATDKDFFSRELPLIRHELVVPCLAPRHEKALIQIRARNYARHFDFLYVGNNNFANVVAVKWLLTEVIPLLRGSQPRIAIVGRVKESMRKLHKQLHEQFKEYFVGSVPDVGVYYAISDVVLVPSLVGTGCSLKFIEALCAGKTVIVTADSLRGLPEHIREQCVEFVCDTPQQFAQAMLTTLARRRLGNREAELVYDDYFHSNHYMIRMKNLLHQILLQHDDENISGVLHAAK
jgi:glycosyltransferase involved in cell wall biosynthesis